MVQVLEHRDGSPGSRCRRGVLVHAGAIQVFLVEGVFPAVDGEGPVPELVVVLVRGGGCEKRSGRASD